MIVILLISELTVLKYVPESPLYLFENNEFSRLEISLNQIAKINGIPDHEVKVKKIVERLKI